MKKAIDQSSHEYKSHDLKRGVDYIGVTVAFFCHDGQGNLLMHLRNKNCRDEHDKWDVGGGSMEFGETFEQAVRREIKEEYCVEPLHLDFIGVNNVVRKHNERVTHWVCLIFAAQVDPDLVQIGEPHKMDAIGFFPIDNLPEPRHSMIDEHLAMIRDAGVL